MTLEELRSLVQELGREGLLPPALGQRHWGLEMALNDLGIDSVGRLTLLNAIEAQRGALISESQLQGVVTVGDLLGRL